MRLEECKSNQEKKKKSSGIKERMGVDTREIEIWGTAFYSSQVCLQSRQQLSTTVSLVLYVKQ